MTKKKYINPILRNELKNNFVFIMLCFVLLFLYSYVLPKEIIRYFEKQETYLNLQKQVDTIEDKLQILNNVDNVKVEETLKVFSGLIPLEEDYYSIISTLNKLSLTSGLNIEKYTINFQDKKSNSIMITIDTTGDTEKLFLFFKNYFVSAGRLVTLDSFEYVPNFSSKSITLFFHRMPELKLKTSYTKASIDKALNLGSEISLLRQATESLDIIQNSTVVENVVPIIGEKQNPFIEE